MNFLVPLLIGLILGWLVEWLIDWLFWRPERTRAKARLTEAELELSSLRLELANEWQVREKARVVEAVTGPRTIVAEPARHEQLSAAEATLSNLGARLTEYQDQLAACQAEAGQLRVQLADDQQRRAQLASAQGQLAQLRRQLAEAQRGRGERELLVAQAERARNQHDDAAFAAAEAELTRLDREVVALKDELSRNIPMPQPDDLAKVTGIGPVFAERLVAAGLRSFRDIAESSPARLKQIAGVKKWHKIDPDLWIAEAAEFASGKRR
jgi:predicted flap endonuclease-1-like 5' DNA nuclease